MRGHAPSLPSQRLTILGTNVALQAPARVWGAMPRADARLRRVVDEHVGLVWRVLRRAGLSPADAEDASQDVFWVLAQRIEDVPERAQRSFLVSTALRVASDRRRSKWNRSVSGGLDAEARVSDAALPDEALETLEASERAVFILADLEQMTRAEVAQALRIPEGTVASRLRQARTAFEASVRRLRAQSRSST